jgi:tetratricopeptide (TPR) repeat protein
LRFSLSVSLMLILCAAAYAQTDSARRTPASESNTTTPRTSNATRARRVTQTAVGNDSSPAKNPVANKPKGDTDTASSSTETPEVLEETVETPASASVETPKVDRIQALRTQIEGAKNEGERSRLRRTLIDYLVALDKKSEAIDELRAMAQEERSDPAGFYNIGNALARLGDTDGAINAYGKAIEQRRGNYSRALNNLGVVQMRANRLDQAYESFVSALKLENFRYAEASYNLGRLYTARGETESAKREWSRALVVQPNHSNAALSLARALAASGDVEHALAILDAFTTRNGPNSEIETARREITSAAPASGKKLRSAKSTEDKASPTQSSTRKQ